MMYKMLVTDIDDTLLRNDLTISKSTKEALAAARAQGVIVTLATGRMFPSAKQIAEQIELNVPIVSYQGALVKNLQDEHVLYERTVPQETAKRVFAFCRERDLHLQVYSKDRLYCQDENEKIKLYSKMSNVSYTVESNFDALQQRSLTKLLIFDDPDRMDRLENDLRAVVGPNVHVTRSKPYFLEILHREGTKGHALRFLARYFECDISRVIAVGDSWNDHEMIEAAGLGVAVENAVGSLKAKADYITKTNDQDGVKNVIDRFILS